MIHEDTLKNHGHVIDLQKRGKIDRMYTQKWKQSRNSLELFYGV